METKTVTPQDVSSGHATYWEQIASTRWGRYITEIERAAIEAAAARFGEAGDALEVGCEGGRWSRMLTDAGWSMTCTDICEQRLAICQQRVPEAKCILADPHQPRFPVEDNCCDLLVAIEVPVSDECWFAEEVARVLRPDGVAVFTLNNRASYRAWLSNRVAGIRFGRSFYKSSYVDSCGRFESQGFQVVDETGYCWMPFSRASNSRLIPLLTSWEQRLGLRNRPKFAPWIAVVAAKTPANHTLLTDDNAHNLRVQR